jgi:hypothetical protein
MPSRVCIPTRGVYRLDRPPYTTAAKDDQPSRVPGFTFPAVRLHGAWLPAPSRRLPGE